MNLQKYKKNHKQLLSSDFNVTSKQRDHYTLYTQWEYRYPEDCARLHISLTRDPSFE